MPIVTLQELKAIWEAIRDRGYDPGDDAHKIKSMQKKFRDSFTGVAVDATKWDVSIGAGGAVSVSAGILTIGSGTTIAATTSMRSKEVFTIPFRVTFNLGLSQRIANQTFKVEAVSVDPVTLLEDGKHSIGYHFDGVTATQAKYMVKNGGGAELVSAASTVPTTVGGVSIYEIEPYADEAWFHAGTQDASTGRANSYRRHQQIPDPNAVYKIKITWLNGGSAPSSNTNATMQFMACQDYAELTAEITAGRGQTVAGQAMGVAVVTMPTTTVTGTVTATNTTPTPLNVNSAATTNATAVKASAGTLFALVASNTAASARFLKLYNKATAPTVGTDVPVLTIPIAAGSFVEVDFGTLGHRFATGIALAITGLAADSDVTVIAANEVKALITYV